jgi:hypothetical protein
MLWVGIIREAKKWERTTTRPLNLSRNSSGKNEKNLLFIVAINNGKTVFSFSSNPCTLLLLPYVPFIPPRAECTSELIKR